MINGNDMKPMFWNGQPKMTFGITLYASWKGLDFNMLWSGAAKYTAKYNEVLGNVLALDSSNSPGILLRPLASGRRLRSEQRVDSRQISGYPPYGRRQRRQPSESNMQRINAAHARLKNLELGYTLPAKLLRGSGISSCAATST